ncbi:MAG: GHKL domain-containing protein [Oscillospiraceae bacterium]|nr:GHKL domain-containing protein [Oscillospiraceae bacterium]
MEQILINIMGTSLGIFATLILFETFLVYKRIKRIYIISGILINAIVSVVLTVFLLNSIILPILVILLRYVLSYYFYSNTVSRIMLTLLSTAIAFISETLIMFFQMQVLLITIEQVQESMPVYLFGVITSQLFALFVVFILRIFFKKKKIKTDKQFNLLMAFMPVQSIIICYIVFLYFLRTDSEETSMLGLIAIALSITLIVITMIILNRLRDAMIYKNEYELAQEKLKIQIEHYQDLYQEQQKIKLIRHDISNKLIAISSLVKKGNLQEVIDKMSEISESVLKSTDIVDTGFPPIDAILSVKTARAKEADINLVISIIIDGELYIDQFDIAEVIANALDNAIEGVVRSKNVTKIITINISRTVDYISIVIENFTEGPIYDDFQTTKPDKKNHGYGIVQMRDIAQKYNGLLQPTYNLEEKKFTLKILLKNQQT